MTQHEYRDHEMPKGLCGVGITAVDIIRGTLRATDALFTGGCKPFYSPDEWRERGEWRAIGGEPDSTVLIVCHDGGDMSHYSGAPKIWSAIDTALNAAGYRVNYGEHWWTYITHPEAAAVFGDKLKKLHARRCADVTSTDTNFTAWLVRVILHYRDDTGCNLLSMLSANPSDFDLQMREDDLVRWLNRIYGY